MGSKRKRSRESCSPAMEETPTPSHIPPLTFQTLISAIQALEGPKLPLLKRLYFLLVTLSLNEPMRCSNFEGAFDHCGVEGKLEDIHNLINVLFEELDRRFKLFFSALCDVFASRGQEHIECDTDMFATADELPLLLRCCMLVLALADPTMLVEKTQFLLSVLGSLIYLVTNGGEEKNSVRFQKFVSSKFTYTDVGGSSTTVSEEFVASLCFTEPSDPWCPTLCAVLEIFADELVTRRLLREYFSLVDSTSPTTEILFQCHFVKGDIGSVLEHCRVPELSLTSAVSLLQNPIMLSAPKMLQTHMTLLVSEAIDVDMSLKNARPDLRLMEGYLTAFERSVHLYTSHMSGSLMDFHPLGVKCSYDSSCMLGRSSQPSFESYIQQVTRDKIYELVTNSDSLWDLYLCNMFHRTKADLMAASIAYVNESQHIFDESCRDHILSVLRSIILLSFSCDVSDTVLYRKGVTSPQDMYLLASILKLMSTSLLKAICSLRHGGDLGSPRTLKDVSSKEYDFVVDIIGCFHQFNVSLPNQKFLFDMMKTCPLIHKTSKWMLLHFSGLLSLCFASGIDFLVKGCISTIMALLHLYVFEESDLVALSSLLVSGSQTFSSGLSSDKVTEAMVKKKSVRRVAMKFQKIQTLHLSKESQSEVAETSENACFMRCTRESMDVMEETEETCNGEVFLNCILGSSQKSDIDDLADFIVCNPAKDYSSWWKDRERYRGMKIQRKKQLRWEKRKNAWKSMVGKKHR
ncbi:uncharacterized protein LOC110746222 isoform X2 [Prunus avium]|uniref:Uncharacterized protein LOC110746222 isoform X2 n=1 Tax=Prunus avium TaxID=42229 RepID=A0A6P5RH56_PRUAV|nr:uncharacterized protein LOC110746222 isoform X2 [Prunus avium]